MLHSVNWLDIVGDKELCLLKRGMGERTGVVTRHNLENLATRHLVEAKSQQFQFTDRMGTKRQSTTGSTQRNGKNEEKTEAHRSERRGKERKHGKGILKD